MSTFLTGLEFSLFIQLHSGDSVFEVTYVVFVYYLVLNSAVALVDTHLLRRWSSVCISLLTTWCLMLNDLFINCLYLLIILLFLVI